MTMMRKGLSVLLSATLVVGMSMSGGARAEMATPTELHPENSNVAAVTLEPTATPCPTPAFTAPAFAAGYGRVSADTPVYGGKNGQNRLGKLTQSGYVFVRGSYPASDGGEAWLKIVFASRTGREDFAIREGYVRAGQVAMTPEGQQAAKAAELLAAEHVLFSEDRPLPLVAFEEKAAPTAEPTEAPAEATPTVEPSEAPAEATPTLEPTEAPAETMPTVEPTEAPAEATPTVDPSEAPAEATPTVEPSEAPAEATPTVEPTEAPAEATPTVEPSEAPAEATPTVEPTEAPAEATPTVDPSEAPAEATPTVEPSEAPAEATPTVEPTEAPAEATPTVEPTEAPAEPMPPVNEVPAAPEAPALPPLPNEILLEASWSGETLGIGDTITLTALCDACFVVVWQYMDDQGAWIDTGAEGSTYAYELTEDNYRWLWRAVAVGYRAQTEGPLATATDMEEVAQ